MLWIKKLKVLCPSSLLDEEVLYDQPLLYSKCQGIHYLTLLFLPDSARDNLADMGNSADQEVAMSRQDKEIATEASWKARYILWLRLMGIPDPCGRNGGYKQIIAIYIKFLQYGVNYTNKDGLQSANPGRLRQSHLKSIHPLRLLSPRQPL